MFALQMRDGYCKRLSPALAWLIEWHSEVASFDYEAFITGSPEWSEPKKSVQVYNSIYNCGRQSEALNSDLDSSPAQAVHMAPTDNQL